MVIDEGTLTAMLLFGGYVSNVLLQTVWKKPPTEGWALIAYKLSDRLAGNFGAAQNNPAAQKQVPQARK